MKTLKLRILEGYLIYRTPKSLYQNLRKDLTLTVAFEIKLTLIYGVRIPDVVEKVRGAVKHEVEELTGCKVDRIDILVEKLVRADLPPELPTAEK
jgi:uncharacterized alkaline shock family protein YloU